MGDVVSKLTLDQAISAFGASAKAGLSNSAITGQPEDQLRTPLMNLFDALAILTGKAPGTFKLVGETSLAGMQTRPDFAATIGIGDAKALIGFIEVKAPGKGADPRKFKGEHDKAQWAKLKALPNLIYTDGSAFSLWQNGELVDAIVKFDGDIESAGSKLTAPASLLPLVTSFLSWTPIPPRSASELAVTAARLCRFLRDEVVERMEQGSKPLLDLAKDWRTLLFPNADNAQFADGYAQAVTFGLLMAKSLKLSLDDDLDSVAKKLGQSNTLIGTALRLLTEQPETLQASLATMTRVLDVVDWDKVSKGDPEAWLYFYEQFLDTYDRKLRKLTGSYYTPPQVVKAMVRLCDEALKSPGRFKLAQGIASPEVHIADPATGSGTYLLAIVRQIADTIEAEQGPGAVLAGVGAAVQRLYGFEVQFGAFAVAQLRLLAEMIEIAKNSLPPGAEIDEASLVTPHLFVTDTLGDPYEHEETGTVSDACCRTRGSKPIGSRQRSLSLSSSAIRRTRKRPRGAGRGWRMDRPTAPRCSTIGSRQRNGAPERTPSTCATCMSISGAGRHGRCFSREQADATSSHRSPKNCRASSATLPLPDSSTVPASRRCGLICGAIAMKSG